MSVVRLNEVIEKMKLENLTPEIDTSGIKVRQPDINRPAIQMTGYFDHMAQARIQIMGFVEYTYMESLSVKKKKEAYEQLLSYDIPAVDFCRELIPDEIFLEMAVAHNIPVLMTKKSTSAK